MKKGDYQTDIQARDYNAKRFRDKLSIVHEQETTIVTNWIRSMNIKEGAKFADIGTGTGRIIGELLPCAPSKVFAVDVSSAMLRQLSKNYPKEIKSHLIEPLLSSSDNLNIDRQSVDLITSFHLFKHLADLQLTISSIGKILKPKGYFIFDVLNKQSLISLRLLDCYAYTFNYIREILGKEGLIIKDVIYLRIFGETIYKIAGKFYPIIYFLDKTITNCRFKMGTNMLILAQKL